MKNVKDNTPKIPKKYYRAKEVSNYLGIGLSTVWHFAKIGKLNPIKLTPRVTVFDVVEIDDFIMDGNSNVSSD